MGWKNLHRKPLRSVHIQLWSLGSNVVRFDPPLPEWKKEAIARFRPVYFVKIFLKFPRDFWDDYAIRWRYEISRQAVWARRKRLGTRLVTLYFRYPSQQVVTESFCTNSVDRPSGVHNQGTLQKHGRPTEESLLCWRRQPTSLGEIKPMRSSVASGGGSCEPYEPSKKLI